MIYLDNAATSWPKPDAVCEAMAACLNNYGANPGRSGHRMAMQASEKIYECRGNLARLFGIGDPLRIAFTANATEAINLAVKGLLKAGDHAIISSMEHNSVVRPLKKLEKRGTELSIVRADSSGQVGLEDIERNIKPKTKLLLLTHASNISGTLNDIRSIGTLAKRHKIVFMVDAAQTAGKYPLDVESMQIDLLAFPGHKSLLGPQGTGGLYIREGLTLDTLKEGGTGSVSESLDQPEFSPDRYESGTLNTPGIAGLNEGVKYILKMGIDNIRKHENKLEQQMLKGLGRIPGVKVYGSKDPELRNGVISITINGRDCQEVCNELDEKYGIACRGGLHCAVLAHETMGTQNTGSIRFSIGPFNTGGEIDRALSAIKTIAGA